MDTLFLREFERILIVLCGGMSVFLGYRLFLNMPAQTNSQGKMLLPGGISIYMSRIGPGAFFALFGCTVLALSFVYGITYSETSGVPGHGLNGNPPASTGSEPGTSKSFSGFGEGGATNPRERLLADRLQVKATLGFLNGTLPDLLNPALPESRRRDVELNMPRVRLALIQSVWSSDWGNFEAFRTWVDAGARRPAPRELAAEPANLFAQGATK